MVWNRTFAANGLVVRDPASGTEALASRGREEDGEEGQEGSQRQPRSASPTATGKHARLQQEAPKSLELGHVSEG